MDAIPVPVFERHNTCLTCGYDLFGQPRGSACPECGNSTRESARHEAFLGRPGNVARLKSGAALLLWSSILSGLCPAACLLFLAQDQDILRAMLVTLIFAATVITAAMGELRFAAMREFSLDDADDRLELASRRSRRIADIIACIGLGFVNAAAYVISARSNFGVTSREPLAAALIAIGFSLLAVTAWRATPAYRLRAAVADACLIPGHRGFIILGSLKTIFETAWLGCISLGTAMLAMPIGGSDVGIFLLIGGLFGLAGYGLLWIGMIAVHAVMFARVRHVAVEMNRGFDVVNATSQTAT